MNCFQVKVSNDEDKQLDFVGCSVQVFKLRGADRKHKQEREKIQKKSRWLAFFNLTIYIVEVTFLYPIHLSNEYKTFDLSYQRTNQIKPEMISLLTVQKIDSRVRD
jgi:hypothetical protein